jgi:hypothetical protein
MVSGLRSHEYADRLKELRLTTLSERRHQADMLMMYKLSHGHGKLDEEGWFEPPPPAAARMRWHADPLNVRPNHGRLELRQNVFFGARRGGVEFGPARYKKGAHRHRLQDSLRHAQARYDLNQN